MLPITAHPSDDELAAAFSHSISYSTKASVPLDTLTQEIDNGYFRGTIRVVEYEGKFYSLDNRHVATFKLLGYDVPVTVVDQNNPDIHRKFSKVYDTQWWFVH